MKNNNIGGLLESTIEKISDLVKGNVIMGEQITTPDGTIIIPITKLNIGFGSGGTDIVTKNSSDSFGGGGGGGVSVVPLGFLVIQQGNVKLVQLAQGNNPADRLINMVPEVFDKVSSLIPKKDKAKKEKNGDESEK